MYALQHPSQLPETTPHCPITITTILDAALILCCAHALQNVLQKTSSALPMSVGV